MKKRNITFAVLLLAVVLTAVGVSGTYARYTTTATGKGKATVAKWKADFKDTENNSITTSTQLVLDQEENTYVAKGKIAPDASVYNTIIVDLTGTEVATDIEVTIDEDSIQGFEGDISRLVAKISPVGAPSGVVTKEVNGVTSVYVPLNSARTALVANTITLKVELDWENDEDANVDDTEMGVAPGDITVDLTLTAKQHIESDDN